ncbi:MAG: glycosyltransferase family 39 protein [Patescibacteria group bacterium]
MTNFRRYLLISLVIALVSAVLILIFFLPQYDHPDTQEYVSAIKKISGDESGEISPYRILKPLPILIGAFLTNFTAAENTLVIQSLFFYFLSVGLIYFLVWTIYNNEKQAFLGAILFATAYPVLAYGIANLTDMSGWFFFLLSALLSVKFIKNPASKTVILAGLIAGFGMLFKESVAAALIFFVSLMIIAFHYSFKEKIKYIFIFGSTFLIFPLINSIIIYNLFSYSYFNEFLYIGVGSELSKGSFFMVSPLRILIETGRVFLFGWIFVLLGIWKEFIVKNKERIKILISFLPCSLSFFFWIYPHNRMMYIAAPLLILLGSFGLIENFKNKKNKVIFEFGLISVYIISNYFILDFLLKYGAIIQPPGTLFG